MPMQAFEIQAAVFRILKDLKLQLQPGSAYSLSELQAEYEEIKATYPNALIASFLANYEEYRAFQRRLNGKNLWVRSHRFEPLNGTDRQMHDCLIIERR